MKAQAAYAGLPGRETGAHGALALVRAQSDFFAGDQLSAVFHQQLDRLVVETPVSDEHVGDHGGIFQGAARHGDAADLDVSGEARLAHGDGGDGNIGGAVSRKFFAQGCGLGDGAVSDDDEGREGSWIDGFADSVQGLTDIGLRTGEGHVNAGSQGRGVAGELEKARLEVSRKRFYHRPGLRMKGGAHELGAGFAVLVGDAHADGVIQ